jgi:hypothetical protein
LIVPGQKFPDSGAEVLSVGAPEPAVMHIKTGDKATLTVPVPAMVPAPAAVPLELPVRLRTNCALQTATDGTLHCTIGGLALAPDVNVRYSAFNTILVLRVSEVHYPGRSRTATVGVRFMMSPEARIRLKAADRDVGARAHPAGQMATILSLVDRGDATPAMLSDVRLRQAIPTNRLVAVDAVLTVPLEETPLGWMYKSALVKVGAPFSFETETYTVDGGVTNMTTPEQEPAVTSVAPASR